jgi:hypothetical protein
MVRIKYEKGLEFVIYANDHEPIHVHVKSGSDEGIFRLKNGEVTFHEDRGLSNREVRDATEILEDNMDEFISEWNRLNR